MKTTITSPSPEAFFHTLDIDYSVEKQRQREVAEGIWRGAQFKVMIGEDVTTPLPMPWIKDNKPVNPKAYGVNHNRNRVEICVLDVLNYINNKQQ